MDKLEKALEKARQQRKVITPFAAQKPVASNLNGHSAHQAPMPRPSTLTTVHEAQLERNRIVAHRTRSHEADVFRILRTQVLQAMQKHGYKTIGITSPNYGDGKTTISLNLAISIVLDLKQTALLVDLDLRKPSVQEYLELDPAYGLTDHLLDDVPITQCLTRLNFERLTVLPCGRQQDNSSEVLGSPKMAALAHELKNRYADRLIIYDMPPILAQDDPIAFLPHVDAVLLVVKDGSTPAHDIKRCMDALAGANVIGTVLNNHL